MSDVSKKLDPPELGRELGRPEVTRRRALTTLGGFGVAVVAGACAAPSPSSASNATTTATPQSGGSTSTAKPDSRSTSLGSTITTPGSQPACLLFPETTEGPYFIRGDQIRRDVTEGRPGAPLDLHIKIVDAAACTPFANVAVDIWHCDASGIYSGFVDASRAAGGGPGSPPGANIATPAASSATDETRFLRGIQVTDQAGLVQFATIYPGWYRGRAVHIHVKVGSGSTVHTGQLFFPDDLTDSVFANEPYKSKGVRDMRNADDSIFAQTSSTVLDLTREGERYVGTITLGVSST